MAGKQERIMFIYLCEKSRICIFWQKRLFLQAEEKGFEPLRRCYRPTGVRSQTLQPLGYSSRLLSIIQYPEKIFKTFPCGFLYLLLYLLLQQFSPGPLTCCADCKNMIQKCKIPPLSVHMRACPLWLFMIKFNY